MKKMMVAVALLMGALAFTACNGEGCYQVTLKWGDQSNTVYVYGDGATVDAEIDRLKAAATLIGAEDIKVTRKKVNKSQEDCLKQGL